MRLKLNLITKEEYEHDLTKLLRGRSVDDWLHYYKKYKNSCFKVIDEENMDKWFRNVLLTLLILVLILPFSFPDGITGMATANTNRINVDEIVSIDSYLIIDGIATPSPGKPVFYNGEYVYKIKSLDLPDDAGYVEIMDNGKIIFSKNLK